MVENLEDVRHRLMRIADALEKLLDAADAEGEFMIAAKIADSHSAVLDRIDAL